MQFGKVYVDPKANLTEKEFYDIVRGQNLGGIDRRDAWKKYDAAKEKKQDKKQKEEKFDSLPETEG